MAVGLSILLAETDGYTTKNSSKIDQNMIIVRQVIKLSQNLIIDTSIEPQPEVQQADDYCYLKSCHFCHMKLQPKDDIYMYKGDQGYCTEECRSKAMKVDKAGEEKDERQAYMKKLEIKHKNSGRCSETLSILRDLRHRTEPVHLRRNGGIFF